jgi:hypothetical protein
VIIRSADSRIGWKLRAKAYTPLRDLRQEQGCGRNIRGQAGQLAAKIRTLISFLNHHCFVEDENEVLMQRSFPPQRQKLVAGERISQAEAHP